MNHSVRFVRALVLAAALPGCSAAEDPSQKTEAQATEPTDPVDLEPRAPAVTPPPVVADAAPAAVDASQPKTSGPIVPPELETA